MTSATTVALAALAAATAFAAEIAASADPLAEWKRAEASRTVSSDGSITVEGEALALADRIEISGFVADFRRKTAELFYGPGSHAGAGTPPLSASACHVIVRASSDNEPPVRFSTRLFLPDPPASGHATLLVEASGPVSEWDAHQLGAVIANGWFRLAVLLRRAPAASAPASAFPPPWFSKGLLRSLDPALRQGDFDAIRAKWGTGQLPPLDALASFGSRWSENDDALAAQLVAFWLSFPDKAGRFGRLVDSLAAGVPWTADLFALSSLGAADAERADAAFDNWLVAREGMVLTPGVATPAGARRLLSSLWLVPGRDGVPRATDTSSSPALPPEALFLAENAAWAPAAAGRLRRKVQLAAAGRGDAWRAACERLDALLLLAERGRALPDGPDRLRACLRDLAAAAESPDSPPPSETPRSPQGTGGALERGL